MGVLLLSELRRVLRSPRFLIIVVGLISFAQFYFLQRDVTD